MASPESSPTPLRSALKGKRVVVTRAIEQTADLSSRLIAQGAIPISLPLVSFAPPENYAPLDAALDQLNSFHWIIFTSANAVHAVTSRAQTLNLQIPVILRTSDQDVRRTSTQPHHPNPQAPHRRTVSFRTSPR